MLDEVQILRREPTSMINVVTNSLVLNPGPVFNLWSGNLKPEAPLKITEPDKHIKSVYSNLCEVYVKTCLEGIFKALSRVSTSLHNK